MAMRESRQNGDLFGGGHFNWYWDDLSYSNQDPDVRTDCLSTNWPNQHIRRCHIAIPGNPFAEAFFANYEVTPSERGKRYHEPDGPVLIPDTMAIRDLNWTSHDGIRHHDAFGAKGYLWDAQNILKPSNGVLKSLIDHGENLLPDIEFDSREAYVQVNFYITDLAGHSNINFRQVPT